MSLLVLLKFLVGLALLPLGAELLVRGATRLAAAVGSSPLVIGLTVVAYGTSAPEIAVSIQAALAGNAELTLGNVVGSNIFNILFVLGVSALIVPLVISVQLLRLDVPLMIAASVLLLLLGYDGRLSRMEGGILLVLAVAYTVFVVVQSRKESKAVKAEFAEEFADEKEEGEKSAFTQVALIVVGLGLLVWGAQWLVEGAVVMAKTLGVSDLVIGLTVIAIGTSLPEIATAVVASLRGERDIVVGNVVGSNLSNILAVLGVAALIAPNGMAIAPGAISVDIPIMIAASVACLPIFFIGHRIARWEGGLFLAYYVAYMIFLFMSATHHHALYEFTFAMATFVIPLTVVTLGILVYRTAKASRAAQPEGE